MTTIATTALPVADSWTVSVGGGWIVVMLIGMALCFAFMWLMRGGQGWRLCGSRRPLETALTFGERYIWGVTAGILRNLRERIWRE